RESRIGVGVSNAATGGSAGARCRTARCGTTFPTAAKETEHEEDAGVHRLRPRGGARAADRLPWAVGPRPQAQVGGGEVLGPRGGGQERLPDGQPVVRGTPPPRRPEGRLDLRAGGLVREARQRQPAAARVTLGGGLCPPSEASPRESIAPA